MARRLTAARRYAEALFELAERDGTLDETRRSIELAAELLARPEVAEVVDNPAVPLPDRLDVLERLLGPRVTRQVLNLARLLTEKNRIELAPAIAREYATLLNRARGIVEAVVTTARPLGPDEVAEVRRKVEELAGAAVDLRVVVDPSLIGGLTVRVGDRLLDASVRGRLERLRARLLAGAR